MDSFGKKIRELRLKKDFSLRDLAERAKISYSFIGSLEKGRFKPSRDTVHSLANALDHPADELLLLAGFAPETPSTNSENTGRVHEEKYDYRTDPRVHGELKELLDIIVRLPEEQQKRIIEQTLVFAAGLEAKNRSSKKE